MLLRELILPPVFMLAASAAAAKILPSPVPELVFGATADEWAVTFVSAIWGLIGGGSRAMYRPAIRRKLRLGLWTYPLLGMFVAGGFGMGAVALFDYPPMAIYMAAGFIAYFAPNILDRAEPRVEKWIERAGTDKESDR